MVRRGRAGELERLLESRNDCPREKKEEEENKEEFQKERKAKSTLKELRGGSKEVG